MIATDLPSIDEVLRDDENGLIVRSDLQGLSDAVITLLDDPAKRARLARGAAMTELSNWDAAHMGREGSSPHVGEILRYDGRTGEPLGVFVPPNSGGLNSPQGMLFGPDGSLYVASGNWWAGPEAFYKGAYPAGAVLHFQGPAGASPGAFLGTFVAGGSGGLANPAGMVFGPDASGDGRTDLYVANSALKDGVVPIAGTSGVLRYDAASGAFLGMFVAPGNGLKFATFLTFTETDPSTLNYNGGNALTAGRTARVAAPTGLSGGQVRPLLAEAIRRWNQSGLTAGERNFLRHVRFQVTDLDGLTLGTAAGTTITLDGNAAGWGWFADRTPRSDREFSRSGDQGSRIGWTS